MPRGVTGKTKIIASPSCIAIGLATVMKPIHDAAGISRIVVTTFQSVSGRKKGIDELAGQTVGLLNFQRLKNSSAPDSVQLYSPCRSMS